MGHGVHETRLFRYLINRRWLSVGLVVLIFCVLALGLAVCFVLGTNAGHFADYEGIPPVSAMGDMMPEHAVFVVTFGVCAILLGLVMFLRAGQFDMYRRSKVNHGNLALGWAALPFFILLAVLPMAAYGKTVGYLHLASAGVCILCFSIYTEWVSILALVRSFRHHGDHPEHNVVPPLRIAAYGASFMLALMGSILFAIWLIKLNETRTSSAPINGYEWAGLTILFTSLFPTLLYFSMHAEGHYRPLN